MRTKVLNRLGKWLVTAALLTLPLAAEALTKAQTLTVEGILTTGGTAAVADGDYFLTFSLYDQESGGNSLWKEGPLGVTVKGGHFSVQIGAQMPITPTLFTGGSTWLGVAVGLDPELPRKPMGPVPMALVASQAQAVDCSGCIGAKQLDATLLQPFAKTADLAPFAKTADLSVLAKTADLAVYAKTSDLGAYAKGADLANYAQKTDLLPLAAKADLSDFVKAASLAKVAGTGSYTDLADKPTLATVATSGKYTDLTGAPVVVKAGSSCGTGLVVQGIKADGSLDCIAGGISAANLPPDGLNEVSNGTLTNQFTEVVPSMVLPKALPDGLGAGVSDGIVVPDFGTASGVSVTVKVTNSDVSKVRVDLFDPSGTKTTIYNGGKTGTSLNLTFDFASVPATAAWIGKNAAGSWSITVADLFDNGKGTDGTFDAWSVQVQTVSSKKVSAQGLLSTDGGLKLKVATSNPVTCDASNLGYIYVNTVAKALYVCNGTDFFPVLLDVPGTQKNPGAHCKDIVTKAPGSKTGVYWIDPDANGPGAPYQVYCDMDTQGGGWTLIASTQIPWSGNGGGDTTWTVGNPSAEQLDPKSTGKSVSLVNRIPFAQLADFRFSCLTSAAATGYGIDWVFNLPAGGNSALMSDIYDDGKIGIYGKGLLTQTNGKQRLIGYDNATSKADWGLGSEGGDTVYWSHEAWGQVDNWGGHCQDPGTGHTTTPLSGTGIYHIWVR